MGKIYSDTWCICIDISMICSDINGVNTMSEIISPAVRRVKFETIWKHHKWYLYQISHTNHAIICLCYYPQRFCNFHIYTVGISN